MSSKLAESAGDALHVIFFVLVSRPSTGARGQNTQHLETIKEGDDEVHHNIEVLVLGGPTLHYCRKPFFRPRSSVSPNV